MRLALKLDVDTYRGTREGVPRLMRILAARHAGTTFLFSLGPDHTGRAVRRVFRRGFVGKVARTSVLEHYGVRTLLYGTLLPGPDIGARCAPELRAARDAGFETGIHCWDHVRWQDGVARAGADWTRAEMRRAFERYAAVFGEPAFLARCAEVEAALARLKLDWPNAMVLVSSQAGSNVSSGLTEGTNWLAAFLRAASSFTLPDERIKPIGREVTAASHWILIDFGSIIIHVFTPPERDYYALEKHWSEARTILRVQ